MTAATTASAPAQALGPQGQPCCVRPLDAATVCGECTGEVTPVTRGHLSRTSTRPGARVVYDDNGADGDDADHSGVMLEPFVPAASLCSFLSVRPRTPLAGPALDPTPTEPTAEPTPPAPSLPASPPASETDDDEEVEDIEEVEVELEFEEENLVLEVVVDAWAPCTPTSPPAPGLSTMASSTAVASPSASSPRSAGGTLGVRACASLDWAGSGPAPRGLEVIYLAAGTTRLITARDPELDGGDWGGTYNVHVSPPEAETGWCSDYEVRITSERRHPRGQDAPTLLISWLSAWGRPLSSGSCPPSQR